MSISAPDSFFTGPVLAFGAHPDDLEFGCGGILLALAAAGHAIHLLVASRGEAGTRGTPEIRQKETENAAAQLGATLHWVDFGGDARMVHTVDHAEAAARLIREVRPALVLSPTTVETQHPDHVVVGRIVRDALRLARYGKVATLQDLERWVTPRSYQFAIAPSAEPGPGPSRCLVDVSAQEAAWVELMQQHASQMATRRYVDVQLARARVHGLPAGVELAQVLYAEAPLVLATPDALPLTTGLL